MNHGFFDPAGEYTADVQVAFARAGRIGWLVALGYIAWPFALETALHPSDAIWLQYALQGEHIPHVLTAQQMAVGFIETVCALAVLVLLQLVGTVLFYRRAQLSGASVTTPTLWPIAAVLPGVLGNAAWVIGLGYVDVVGCIVGLSSVALTIAIERICTGLGRDFVLGLAVAGMHPPVAQT